MLRLLTYTLLPMAAAFALGYYSEQLHPALWVALVTTLVFSCMLVGDALLDGLDRAAHGKIPR